MLRLVIETRNQIAKLAWTIKPRDDEKGTTRVAPRSPMRCDSRIRSTRSQWLRMVLEDLFVLDAPALYVRRTVGGALYAIEPIDGATIKRILDDHGRTPCRRPRRISKCSRACRQSITRATSDLLPAQPSDAQDLDTAR